MIISVVPQEKMCILGLLYRSLFSLFNSLFPACIFCTTLGWVFHWWMSVWSASMVKRGFKEEFSLNTDLKKYRCKKNTDLKKDRSEKQLLWVRGVSKEDFSVKTDLKK